MENYFGLAYTDETRLDVNGNKYFDEILASGVKLLNGSAMENEKEYLQLLLEKLFPSTECVPDCKPEVRGVKCLKCRQCKPECGKIKNPECSKCYPKLQTFNNSDRLKTNKIRIAALIDDYFTGKNEIAYRNTLALIRLRLSVLPSLL